MNCEAAESLLLDYLEGELDERDAGPLRAHLDKCDACRLALEETRELVDALERAKSVQQQALQASRTAAPVPSSSGSTGWHAGKTIGDFDILGEIGRGGMGVVYRANQISLRRIVALKILPPSVCQTPKAITRFQKEAQAAAKLQHTNIVPVYAQGESDSCFYYAMELIEGQSLDRAVRSQPTQIVPTLPPRAAPDADPQNARRGSSHAASLSSTWTGERAEFHRLALMFWGVADGLHHAHKHGVIHRDMKPQNLLLGPDGRLHITDFGLARLMDEPNVTVTGEMLGTPAYMSPEQVTADRSKIDHRTDIYSLGVTLYEMLTRQRPFDGASREQIIARICADEPKAPRRINPDIPIDLETICMRAMEKDPRRRYQTAGEMAADLRRYAEDRPILSRRVGPLEKAIKWVRRHPALTATITMAVALVIGSVVWSLQAAQAREDWAAILVQKAFDQLALQDYREPAEARDWLDEARRLGADDPQFHKTLGLAYLLDDPKRAIKSLKRALSLRPDDKETMFLLAWAYRRDGQSEACREWINTAKSAEGITTQQAHFFHGQALVRFAPDEATAAYNAALSGPIMYPQAFIQLGRADNHWTYHHRALDRSGDAQRDLSTACRVLPDKAYPRYLLSIAYRLAAEIEIEAGDAKQAEADFGKALATAREAQEVESTSPLGYMCEAEYWESRGDHANALAARNKGAKYCNTIASRVELHQYRWRLRYWLGNIEGASADLDALGAECPESDAMKVWYTGLLPALLAADNGNRNEALRRARSMAEQNPTEFRAVTSTACMLRMLGEREEADRLLTDRAEQLVYELIPIESPPPGWVVAVYEYCRGTATWEGLRQLAGDQAGDTLLWAAPHFFTAADALGRGDRAGALDAFRRCERTFDYDDYCYLAKVFVRKMEADPAWPPWVPAE